MRSTVRLKRRGRMLELTSEEARMTLLDWLRLRQRAVGTKEGCAEGDCGACTVVLVRRRDGGIVHEPVNACILLAGQADGAEVVTVEDLATRDGAMHPVQDAMVRHHASQCGFCTPGIVMSLAAQHADAARPLTRDAICDQLAGNLCRCTGYRPIIDAALDASAIEARPLGSSVPDETVADEADVMVGSAEVFFAAPRSEASLADLLGRHPDALLLAGATDAGLWITKALYEPRKVIWLGRVEGLDVIETTDAALTIGATVTLARAAQHLGALSPDLAEVIRRFGSAQVRASATVGGNLANGSPIGDLAPCLIALGATIELSDGTNARAMPLENFFLAYKKQDRRPREYVRRVIVPLPDPHLQFRAFKITKRMDEDISAVLGAFALHIEAGRVSSARIAFGGMAGTPARATATEAALAGADLDDRATWEPALNALAQDFTPLSDHRASAGYRATVARNLLMKALREASGEDRSTRLSQLAESRDAR